MFQRTANYSVPARNAPLTAEFRRYVKEHAGYIRAVTRETINGMAFRIEERRAVDTPPEEREKIYEAAWERGGLQFRAAFQDMMIDKRANDTAADFIKRKIRSIVKDPATAAILSDIDHPYAAKRPPIDTDYFETFNRDNVTLVDLRNAPIDRISRAGIRTTEAEYPLDIIVFATGFDAMTGPLLRMDIRGRGGLALTEAWAAGPRNLSRPAGGRLPQPVHHHRPRQPVGAVQHAGGDRAARRIGSPTASRTCATAGSTRIEARPDAADDWVAQVNEAANATAAAAGQAFLVPGRQRARQAARLHALCRRHGALSRRSARRRGARLRGLPAVREAAALPAAVPSEHSRYRGEDMAQDNPLIQRGSIGWSGGCGCWKTPRRSEI